ncbi:MAG: hypothetical protein KDE27_30155, partial [Planctomycetes bacterium]|nr:hypothetical protein [Planctomycetota bacterium]
TATGTYSDSSSQDVTALVTWTSSVLVAATVSNASGTEGLTTGIAAGATTITATDPGSAVFGTTVVTTLTDIELRGATSAGNGAGVTTLTLTTPGATEVDDVLVAVVVVRPASATITPPSGWTLVRRLDQSSPNTNSLAVYHRTATASEPASHAFVFSSSTGTAGGIAAFVGVDPGSPVDVEAGQPTASSLSHTAPSIAPASAGTMLFTAHALASSSAWSPPAGMTEAFEAASGSLGSGGGISLCGNWELLAAAGATGTRTATAATNADVGNAAALALRRAP